MKYLMRGSDFLAWYDENDESLKDISDFLTKPLRRSLIASLNQSLTL